ncbi:MAG: ABC transporter substrate-binding protein [Candidatus Kariarchaeaceae archaeon]
MAINETSRKYQIITLVLLILLAFSSISFTYIELKTEPPSRVSFAYNGPLFHQSYMGSRISGDSWLGSIHAGLLGRIRDIDGVHWIPELAEDLPQISADGSSFNITIDLKPGLKFGSGGDLTVDDVIFSYKAAVTPSINTARYAEFATYLENNSVTAIGNTMQFSLTKPTAFYHKLLAMPIIEKALFQERYYNCLYGVYDEHSINRDYCDWRGVDQDNNPTLRFAQGAGPYKVKGFTQNQSLDVDYRWQVLQIVVEKNPNYWDSENVKVDEIEFRWVETNPETLASLDNSSIDITDWLYSFNTTAFASMKHVDSNYIEPTSITEISLNHAHSIWGTGMDTPLGQNDTLQAATAAKYVRQALAHLADRDYIVNEIYEGHAVPAASVIPPPAAGWDETLAPYSYDINQAKILMEKAGYNYSLLTDSDGDGFYEDYFFDVALLVPDFDQFRIEWAERYTSELPRIGIESQLFIHHMTTVLDHTRARPEYQIPPPPDYVQGGYEMVFFHTFFDGFEWEPLDSFRSNEFIPHGLNIYNYANTSLDHLLDNYTQELDFFTRNNLLHQIQKHMKEEVVMIPLVYPQNHMGINCRVKGIDPLLYKEGFLLWKNIGISYASCPDGYGPDVLIRSYSTLDILLLLPGIIAGVGLFGILVYRLIVTRVLEQTEGRLYPDEKIRAKEYIEQAKKIAEDEEN